MATLLKVLNNLADIKSAGGVALGLGTQGGLSDKTVSTNPPDGSGPKRKTSSNSTLLTSGGVWRTASQERTKADERLQLSLRQRIWTLCVPSERTSAILWLELSPRLTTLAPILITFPLNRSRSAQDAVQNARDGVVLKTPDEGQRWVS
jgi:hypothetical protein